MAGTLHKNSAMSRGMLATMLLSDGNHRQCRRNRMTNALVEVLAQPTQDGFKLPVLPSFLALAIVSTLDHSLAAPIAAADAYGASLCA